MIKKPFTHEQALNVTVLTDHTAPPFRVVLPTFGADRTCVVVVVAQEWPEWFDLARCSLIAGHNRGAVVPRVRRYPGRARKVQDGLQ